MLWQDSSLALATHSALPNPLVLCHCLKLNGIETFFFFNLTGLPSPNLHVDPQEALVNQTVTFVCDSDAAQPQGIVTQIKDTNGILASSYSLPLQFQVTAREEANGKEFTCERVLEIHGDQLILLVKNTSVKLTIFCE